MTELDRKLERTAAATAYWPLDKHHEVRRRVRAAADRRRQRGRVFTVAGLGSFALAAALVLVVPRLERPARAPLAMDDGGRVTFSDGSTALPTTGAAIAQLPTATGEVQVALRAGGAEFAVRHQDGERRFRVLAGAVTIEVRGTTFRVEHAADRVDVSVRDGRVAVLWLGGHAELGAGESGRFPPVAPVLDAPVAPTPRAATPVRAARPARIAASWRQLARDKSYASAYAALEDAGRASVADEPGDLLLASDVARLSGHPERAVWPLERIVARHTGDRRAALAAFTLGRVLLDDLGQGRAAADAFARAGVLAGDNELAERALAREVDARLRAGDRTGAGSAAARYRRQYPNGSFRASIDARVGGAAPP